MAGGRERDFTLRGTGFPPRIAHKNFQFLRGPIRGNDEVRSGALDSRLESPTKIFNFCGARYAGMTRVLKFQESVYKKHRRGEYAGVSFCALTQKLVFLSGLFPYGWDVGIIRQAGCILVHITNLRCCGGRPDFIQVLPIYSCRRSCQTTAIRKGVGEH